MLFVGETLTKKIPTPWKFDWTISTTTQTILTDCSLYNLMIVESTFFFAPLVWMLFENIVVAQIRSYCYTIRPNPITLNVLFWISSRLSKNGNISLFIHFYVNLIHPLWHSHSQCHRTLKVPPHSHGQQQMYSKQPQEMLCSGCLMFFFFSFLFLSPSSVKS